MNDTPTLPSPSARALAQYLVSAMIGAVASELGVTPETLRSWRSGRCTPRADHAGRLQRLTHGAVAADGWIRDSA